MLLISTLSSALRGCRAQSGQYFDLSGMIYRLARRLVVGEQFQRLRLVLAYRGHRLVGIGNVSARSDATVNAEDPPDRGSYARMLDDDLRGQARIKRAKGSDAAPPSILFAPDA